MHLQEVRQSSLGSTFSFLFPTSSFALVGLYVVLLEVNGVPMSVRVRSRNEVPEANG